MPALPSKAGPLFLEKESEVCFFILDLDLSESQSCHAPRRRRESAASRNLWSIRWLLNRPLFAGDDMQGDAIISDAPLSLHFLLCRRQI
jgi:hypothetical protein